MHTKELLAGVGIGSALAFILDPDRGRRRRALLRDKLVHTSRVTKDGAAAAARDLGNRTRGAAATARGRFSRRDVGDDILVERVRAKLGRVTTHPRAIDVVARDGEVCLRGPILAREADEVVALAASIPGVKHVVNELETHEHADGIPALQGDGRVAERSLDLKARRWSPAAKTLVGASLFATGACLATYTRRAPREAWTVMPR